MTHVVPVVSCPSGPWSELCRRRAGWELAPLICEFYRLHFRLQAALSPWDLPAPTATWSWSSRPTRACPSEPGDPWPTRRHDRRRAADHRAGEPSPTSTATRYWLPLAVRLSAAHAAAVALVEAAVGGPLPVAEPPPPASSCATPPSTRFTRPGADGQPTGRGTPRTGQ